MVPGSSKNIRNAYSKTIKNGGDKASWLRQCKERRIALPCTVSRPAKGESVGTVDATEARRRLMFNY